VLLREREPSSITNWQASSAEAVVLRAERQVTLCQIDRCWSDYLSHVAEIRDGIHLVSIGGLDAFDEFNPADQRGVPGIPARLDAEVLATLRTVRITPDASICREGLLGPSSTWTYMINDNPMGNILQRLMRGLKQLVTGDHPAQDDDEMS